MQEFSTLAYNVSMRKIIIALAILVMVCSCDQLITDFDNTEVSNVGTVTDSTVAGVTTITIDFPASSSSQHLSNHVMHTVMDTGRYDTLVDVFSTYSLVEDKEYLCDISGLSIFSVKKHGDRFEFSFNKSGGFSFAKNASNTLFDGACTMTIQFGGENIVDMSNLPISPIGLPSGTLWNDHGVLRIVP